MNRLFWRFALLVVLAITLATCAIYVTFSRLFGDPLEEIARRQAAGQIFLLEQYIDKAPADEWLPRLNKVREVSEATLELQPLKEALAALPSSKRGQLRQGAVVIDVGGKGFYRRVDTTGARYIGSDDDVIHAQRLPIDIGRALGMEAIRFGVIALFLLIPIGWWSRRHWRGLLALSKVADDFGQGDLAARAEVRPASSIAPLAGRINDMAERIGLLMEARKNLLHSVSHELRTPIARLEFGLELLRERHADDDPALQKRIAAMETDVEELKTLVNELLSLTQLDQAQSMPRQTFELAPLLRECTPPAHLHQRFNASIAGDLGELQGDARLLARAVNNLLGNAAKYAVGRIVLSAARDGGALRIAVEDDGPGIPSEARERVFEPFYRLEREQDYAASGYGLGLAITAKAVQLHGGAIAVDDSPLGGARFTITL
ncbi:two-component sensor histidine kinase [Duganella sp. BJB488]|uniref:ATP-binding protein n=1 Tax=unclassified Duganella TaxID=2636909 RepID=UPI000E34ADE8|nr:MULTISPECIES: ATP-binding protein [unclassified Duganella]RFP22717.1 two-component sensor histidine kinase [Duganella sp. BJB489]RFP25208.1 two-component sensor histidine kinase [Duganella sp. BJB488]RFP33716.1 two-component sensor histidine kinase [Duganella sp. BJB480]